MCVRATITQDFYISFIKINEENKATATGQQFTWQHYIQTLAHNLPGHTITSQHLPGHTTIGHTIHLASPLD